MDCYVYISAAMSSGLVSILFCLSMMESKGEVSVFLKIFRFFFFGFFSYICLYFDTAFRMQSLVYFVVIFLACLFVFFCYGCYGINPFSRRCRCARWVW